MACGCGGTNGGSGGCGGGDKSPAAPVVEAFLAQELAQELAHELPPLTAAASGVVEFTPPALATIGEPEPLLIASSEQDWPRIRVNGVSIQPDAMAQELQYHPADEQSEAMFLAVQALVIRELLEQRCQTLGLQVEAGAGESQEEAAIRSLIEQEVPVAAPDEAACEHFYASNLSRFVSAPLLAARHILLACTPEDAEARSIAREQGEALLLELQQAPERFTQLAMAHSDCPSKEQGGALGQISKGQTVPEFERQLFRQPQGLVTQPLESRYGYHLVFVDQRLEGVQLPYSAVAESIRSELYQRVWQKAVAHYLQGLVDAAEIEGIHLAGAALMPSDPQVQ